MAPEVRFSSAAAAVKLDVRAAASNARSHANVGRPTTGRIWGNATPHIKKLRSKVPKYWVVCGPAINLLWPKALTRLTQSGLHENKRTCGRRRRRHDGRKPALSFGLGGLHRHGADRKKRADIRLDLACGRSMPEHHRQLQSRENPRLQQSAVPETRRADRAVRELASVRRVASRDQRARAGVAQAGSGVFEE